MRHNIMIIDNDALTRNQMSAFLEREGFFVKAVADGDEALAHFKQQKLKYSLSFVDVHLSDEYGPDLIKKIRQFDPDISLLGFSGDDSVKSHNESLDSGASVFVNKDIDNGKLLAIVHRICRDVERKTKVHAPADSAKNQRIIASLGMAGASNQLAEIANYVLKVAPRDAAVLIRGENGTGKEKIARAIHENSPRAREKFIAVNCGALPENLIESELFGHDKGAFTGSVGVKAGHFLTANKGTIFLDEIGELPLSSQVKFLRVLQEKVITAVGSSQEKKIDVRVITATNADLEAKIADGSFRQDLFYRINILPINLPALRERPDDIPPLTTHILNDLNKGMHVPVQILASTVKLLSEQLWPGNVRDLQGALNRLHVVADGLITDELFENFVLGKPSASKATPSFDYEAFKYKREDDERQLLRRAIDLTESTTEAAKLLGIKRSTLRDRMKFLNIKPKKEIEE